MTRQTAMACLCGAILLVEVQDLRAACRNGWSCPCDCNEWLAGPAARACLVVCVYPPCVRTFDDCVTSTTVCQEASNPEPPGSATWTAEEWAEWWATEYFKLAYLLEDQDVYYAHEWAPDILLGCECMETVTCLEAGDGHWTATWSGEVDLTQPGPHTLTLTLSNDAPTGDCFPLWDPYRGCDYIEAWGDDGEICLEYTVNVVEPPGENCTQCPCIEPQCCCNCPDCPGVESDWIDATDWFYRPCGDDDWAEPIVLYRDDCGNEFSVICTDEMYHVNPGGGTCIWDWGRNAYQFKAKVYDCGKTSLYATFHRTIDTDDLLPSEKDRGTCREYDWLDTVYYSCDPDPQPPPDCCRGTGYPGRNPEAPCPATGNCVNNCGSSDCPFPDPCP